MRYSVESSINRQQLAMCLPAYDITIGWLSIENLFIPFNE